MIATFTSTAADLAAELGADFTGTEHLFLAWLGLGSGPIHEACLAAGLTTDKFREILAAGKPRRRPIAPVTEPGGLSSQAQRTLDLALELAKEVGREEVNGDDLILAMVREPRGAIARALTECQIKPSKLRNLLTDRPRPPKQKPAPSEAGQTPTDGEARPPREPKPPREPRPPRDQKPVVEAKPAKKGRNDDDGIPPMPPGPPRPRPTPAPKPPMPPRRPEPEEKSGGFSVFMLLYLAVPAAIYLYVTHAPPLTVFLTACVGVLPLAGLMGTATEHLAERTGPALGGLLNATFGNAAELIIALAALRAGYVELVKASITGSILGNLLLILGLSLLAGGSKQSVVKFNRTSAGMSAAMLALAVAGLIFPTLFHATHPGAQLLVELHFSEAVAGILIATYVLSLVFVLRTHKPLFSGGDGHGGHVVGEVWGVGKAVALLAIATVGVAVMSEILVHAVEPVTASLGVSEVFLGLIVIPIIGNAAEHGTAVLAAWKGQTDLAFQIALGSSTQIALLIAPILVFAGAILGQPGMNLVFPSFEVIGLAVAVVTSAILTLDGESHWFEGVQLLALYGMLGAAAWFI